MQTTLERLKTLSPDKGVRGWKNHIAHVLSLEEGLCKLAHGLSETRDSAITFCKLQSDCPTSETFFNEISTAITTTDRLLGHLRPLIANIGKVALAFLTQGWTHLLISSLPSNIFIIEEIDLLLQAESHLSHTYEMVSRWCKTQLQFHYLLSPLLIWLKEQHMTPLLPFDDLPGTDTTHLEALVTSLLVSVQSLVSRCPDVAPQDGDDTEKYILKGYQFARDFTHLLNLDNIKDQLDQLLLSISSQSALFQTLERVMPFLILYLSLAKDQLVVHSNWTKALFKLDFVLCSLLQTLSQQGFCQPPEGEEKDANGEGMDSAAGVGIGEGSGTENISKEIEDESQIEGLKGEDGENKDDETNHEGGDAIEMDHDFGGKLEDMPDKGSDDEAESDDGNDPEFDETLGELDDLDPAAVDEKMWGDEKGPEDSGDAEEKAEKDFSKEQSGPSELTAKESNEGKKPKDKSEDKQQADKSDAEDVEAETRSEGGNDDMNDPNVSGVPMDEHVEEANTLDLPDEMDLGGDEMAKEQTSDKEDDEEMDDDENGPEEGFDDVEDFAMKEPSTDISPADDATEERPESEDDTNPVHASGEKTDEEQPDDNVTVEAVAQPDVSKEDGPTDSNEIVNPEAGQNSSSGEAGTSRGGAGESSAVEEKTENDEGYVYNLETLRLF